MSLEVVKSGTVRLFNLCLPPYQLFLSTLDGYGNISVRPVLRQAAISPSFMPDTSMQIVPYESFV